MSFKAISKHSQMCYEEVENKYRKLMEISFTCIPTLVQTRLSGTTQLPSCTLLLAKATTSLHGTYITNTTSHTLTNLYGRCI